MSAKTTEAAFESAIELDLLAKGYVAVDAAGFHRERAIFPEVTLALIRKTQPWEWGGLMALQAAAERTMALLKERRAAAVTGQVSLPPNPAALHQEALC